MSSSSSVSKTPTLAEKHSGIPERLLDKAQRAKSLILATRNKRTAERQRLPVLPQGISRDRFNAAISELRKAVGDANVEINDKPLQDGWYMEHPLTHDPFPLLGEEETVASALVFPSSTAEVQAIVKWANKHSIPISPISMGRNLGYGGAAPRVRGSVVIDLGRRMNKILNIDPDACTCLVEPGVSFYALHEEIQRRGHTHLWIDVPDLGGGSVLGNTLDRGVGYTPYGDHWAMHSGLEVVLPTGEVIRTGMGALPGNNTWQAFPYGFGPYSDGIFSQSNFGIVTKMGMTLMPNPGGHESFMYTFQKDEDLYQLTEIIRPLRIAQILENVAQLRHVTQALAVKGYPRSKYWAGKDPIPADVVARESRNLSCGECKWVYYGTTYGPPDIRKYKLDIVHKEFMKVPGARKIDNATIGPDEYFWSRDRIASGTPDLHELLWVNWMPNGGHIAFSPVSPTKGADAMALYDLAKRRHDEFGIDFFPAFCVGLREMHLIIEIVFDTADADMRSRADRCLRAMIEDAAAAGYGEYRTHLLLMDQVASTYSWNDGALGKFNERLKDALDPNGILAPGRCGIWPKRYRQRGWEITKDGKDTSEGQGVAPADGAVKL